MALDASPTPPAAPTPQTVATPEVAATPAAAAARPGQVTAAATGLYGYAVLSLVNVGVNLATIGRLAPELRRLVVPAIGQSLLTAILTAVLAALISRGRNGARVTAIVIALLSVLSALGTATVTIVGAALRGSSESLLPTFLAKSAVMLAVGVTLLVLLTRPGVKEFFHRPANRPSAAG